MGVISALISPWVEDYVNKLIGRYPLEIKVTRHRVTKLGDFRPVNGGKEFRITVNSDLNPYAFVLTLLHELAHLETWLQHKNKVKPHGKEWKQNYWNVLYPLVNRNIFPREIQHALLSFMKNPKATSCTDTHLLKALRKYDRPLNNHYILEDLPFRACFQWRDGRYFKKGEKLRKRFRCLELRSKKYYLFSPVSEVKWLKNQ